VFVGKKAPPLFLFNLSFIFEECNNDFHLFHEKNPTNDNFVTEFPYFNKNILYSIDSSCNFEIKGRQSVGVMSGEPQLDAVVNIEQFRVVVQLFGNFRDAVNELYRLPKILERPALPDCGTIQLPFVK